jgi:hypothetical protein
MTVAAFVIERRLIKAIKAGTVDVKSDRAKGDRAVEVARSPQGSEGSAARS